MSSVSALKKQTLMARQPIVNNKKETVAYELLYRSDTGDNNAVFDFSGSVATIDVLLNSFTSIYQNNKLNRMPAFINFTYDLLVNSTLPALPSNQIVLEILEDVEVTAELVDAIKSIRNKGYTIALDDFIFEEKFIPLLELVQIVKVDVLEMSFAQVATQVHHLAPYKLILLAEKIETHEMFQHCAKLGFKLFQGYFLSKPEIVEGVKIEPSQVNLLNLIQKLETPDVKASEISSIILQDPVFTFKLLRIVNSSGNQLVREIQSIEEAINLLGIIEIKKWALIIIMVSSENKSEEISRQLLVRGRMCENIAQANGVKDASGYMIAGIMSGVNALLDMEMSELLDQISISNEIKTAISDRQGEMGKVLYNTINYGRGKWECITEDIDADVYSSAYLESLAWAAGTLETIEREDS
jgi:EAL and modified HD-GYP domain-containing signal transduction protein